MLESDGIVFMATTRDNLASLEPLQTQTALEELAKLWPQCWLELPRLTTNSAQIFATLHTPRHAFDIAVALHLLLWPMPLCVAAANGSHNPLARAKTLLLRAQQKQLSFALEFQRIPQKTAQLIESAAMLHATLMQEWKPSRAAAVAMMRKAKTQHQAAALLGIRQQSVSEALQAAHAKPLQALEAAIREILS